MLGWCWLRNLGMIYSRVSNCNNKPYMCVNFVWKYLMKNSQKG